MAKFTYQLKRKYDHKEQLITLIDRKAVNLAGRDVVVTRPATRERPAYDETIPGATQEELAALWMKAEGNHRFIERVEDNTPPAKGAEVAGELAPAGENEVKSAPSNKADKK